MQQIQSFVKQTVGLEKQFYKLLLTQDFDRFHRCFFEYEKDNEIKNQYCLFESLQDKKLQIWNQINSGIKYSLIFNYIISKNKINRINLTDLSQKHETSFAQLFVRYPGDDEIYNHVREKSFTYKYEGEDISFCSQITLDLNQSLVHQNWQKQFQSYLIKSQEMNKLQYFYDFSFDMRMGDKNMYKEIKKNQKPKLWTRDQFFISKLREFQDNQKTDILLNCSGCGPLIRSVGLFEVFIQMINQLKKINQNDSQIDQSSFKDTKREFVENIIYYYMLCQHEQAQLTHFGFQGQVSILLLSFIQIKLILQQSLFKKNPNLFHAVRELVIEFRGQHFANIIKAYFEQEVDVNQLIIQVHELASRKQLEKFNYNWESYLNINKHFDSKKSKRKETLENNIMLLYYSLFYQNNNGQFNWEDTEFVNYLLKKRRIFCESLNQNIYYPNHNSIQFVWKNQFIPPEEYDKILQNVYLKADTEQYAPDVLFLAFHTLSKGRKSNMDIFDILLETCLINFNSNLHGPILATILSSYDFNYHENYVNQEIKNRDDFMNHFLRMDLKTFDIKNRMLFSSYFLNKIICNQEQLKNFK